MGKVSEGFESWWGGIRGFGGEDFGLSWEDLGFRGGLRGEDLGFRAKNFGRSREEIRAFVGIWVFGGGLEFGLSKRFYESKDLRLRAAP